MESGFQVLQQISRYRRKYYRNRLLKGLLILIATVLTAFVIISFLEFSFRFGSIVRFMLLASFTATFLVTFVYWIAGPLMVLIGRKPGITDHQAAELIGKAFPEVGDRLLNYLQLRDIAENEKNLLASAGMMQKSQAMSGVTFENAVDLRENRKYLKYVLSPVSLIVVLSLLNPLFFISPTERIIHFNQEFVPEAPFSFLPDIPEYGFRNEDIEVGLSLEGSAVPETVYLISGDRRIKMDRNGDGSYSYTFKKVQSPRRFRFEAAGFISPEQRIEIYDRPILREFNISLDFPDYTGRKNERINNTGHLEVPEGTKAEWYLNSSSTQRIEAFFSSDSSKILALEEGKGLFRFSRLLSQNESYRLDLFNEWSENREPLSFTISVIKDEYPAISVSSYQDTVLFGVVALAGNISDDYGLRKLEIKYSVQSKKGERLRSGIVPVTIQPGQSAQAYFHQWKLDSLHLSEGDRVSYFIEVFDNDQVNGSKSSRTSMMEIKVPDRSELKKQIEEGTSKTETQAEKSVNEAKELKEKLEKAEERLKGKDRLNWEDEKLIKEILDEKERLEEALRELQEMNRQNDLRQDRFSPQNEKTQEKARQLQELMDQVLDDETRKLYEELQRLLEEKSGVEQVEELLQQMNRKQSNVQKELERALELFKKLKMEKELNMAIEEIKQEAQEQKDLGEKTGNNIDKKENILNDQNSLNEKFDDFKEKIDELRKLNQELDQPLVLPDNKKLTEEIDKDQDEISKKLEELIKQEKELEDDQNSNEDLKENDGIQKNGQGGEKEKGEKSKENDEKQQQDSDSGEKSNKQIGEQQKKTGQKMEQMAEELEQMQASMEMEMMTENMQDLRNIVHNLLKLSFDQEHLFKEFRETNESDPRFVTLSQEQLKLRDDSKVIEDSLISLSKRVFQLSNFITREVTEMNQYMENSMDALKERKKYKAVSDQQFAMTSMNNLALLLDDVLDQMMNAISESSGKGGKPKKSDPSLGEMQKQLNDQIQKLKESGKTGRELSEELAKLAAEQARIREALKEMQRRMEMMEGGGEGAPGKEIPDKMEETELDLVNKRLTEQMIRRQKDILTRLLEAENALREREMDEERKGETANYYEKSMPKSFEEYLRKKEQEIEMLRTVPPKLYPYYKKEVSEYFKRIGESVNN